MIGNSQWLSRRVWYRFTVTSHYTVDADIERDWTIIVDTATVVLQSVAGDVSPEPPRRAAGTVPETTGEERAAAAAADEEANKTPATELIQRKRDRLRRRDFGLSLLLSNPSSSSSSSSSSSLSLSSGSSCNLVT